MALEFWWSVYLSTGHRSWCFKPFFLFRKYWDLSFLLFPRPHILSASICSSWLLSLCGIFTKIPLVRSIYIPAGMGEGYISPSDKARGRYHEHAF